MEDVGPVKGGEGEGGRVMLFDMRVVLFSPFFS